MGEAEDKLELFKSFLRACDKPHDHPLLKEARDFLRSFEAEVRPLTPEEDKEINGLFKEAFHLADKKKTKSQEPFEELIPSTGWLRNYYNYTLRSEPPAVFHFMCALTVLGAALERNVYFNKSFYNVYPNVTACLIAPTGKCRKTSATNVALGLARAVGVNILSERITPEALIQGLSGRDAATGLLYAPELAVFLGRQKYMEGMVPLLTSLFDCPDSWTSKTIMRGEAVLAKVGLGFLGASTMEWFVEALPKEAFSGGFMSRILFVVQESTPREYAFPVAGEAHVWEKLREGLQDIRDNVRGEVQLELKAREWYVKWYGKHHKSVVADEKFAGYHERKPDHLLRIAYLLRIAEAHSLKVTQFDMERALAILDWMEASLPSVFESVASTPSGIAQQRIIKQLVVAGGRMNHSALMRKNQHALTARQFREAIETLLQSETLKEVHYAGEHYYELKEKAR